MASENNLTAVFTDIANAIRDKKGSVNTIKPVNMADEIGSIEVGGGESAICKALEKMGTSWNYALCGQWYSSYYTRYLNTAFYYMTKMNENDFPSPNNVTNMSYMFYYCYSLTSISLFDTSSATDMNHMFQNCSSLITIPLLDTSKVTNMSSMFYSCNSLTSVPQLDTSKVTNMSSMFGACRKLTSIPQFDTSSATDMNSMFTQCENITSIPQLDTSNATNMNQMFYSCNKLTSVQQLNTSKNTNFYDMFKYCYKLTTIPQLNTSSATDMREMFYDCRLLEKIDITMLASKNDAFAYNCYSLKTLIIRTMDTIPTLNSNAFQNCYHFYGTTNATCNPNGLKDGRIYAPDDKVETLKTITNWSVFADIIMPLTIENGEHISKLFIDNSALSLNTSRNASIYLYGFANTPTVNITVSNEGIAQISNITVTTEKITFEVIALGEEGNAIISADINGDYSEALSVEVSYFTPMEHRVEQISDASYGFTLNSNGYYESANKKVANSYSLCKLVFNAKETNKILKLECINNGESSYDFGILSKIDTALSLSNNEDTTNTYKSFKSQSSLNPVFITYPETTAGEHFIYIKYRKDGSGDNGNDSLQFKVI